MADISVTINPPNQIDLSVGAGVTKHAPTHAPGGSDSLSSYYVTGDVVRPSQTGSFLTSGQTGQFVSTGSTGSFITSSQTGQFVSTGQTGQFMSTGQTGYYSGIFYPYSSNPNGYVQGAVVRPSNTGNFIDKTSVQTLSNKYFTTTSFSNTSNPTGIIISGLSVGNYSDPSLIVFESPIGGLKSIIQGGGDDGALAFYTDEGSITLESISKNYPIYLNGNVQGSQYAIFQSGVSGNNLVYNVSNQTISGIKSFVSRPTVGGTGVLLSGEIPVVNTGSLTGAFYPLNSNPSGYITGVDLSNYVTKSSTGSFVTTGQTGSFIVSSQTGQFVSTGATGNFVTGSVVRPSETGSFIVSSQTGAFLDTGSSQTINSLKNFLIRPTVNGTGVLLSGEAAGAANTGSLTGVFYPLNSNPSGYITGVDLSNYVTKSSTGSFVTTGQTGSFITTSQTGQFVWTGSTGSFITTSQTGQFVSTGATGNFVTGSVVRPSETGNFITTAQTGQFVSTGATGSFVVSSQTGAFLTTGAADGRYALQSATGAFVTTGQTGNFVISSQTGAFLTTGAADGRYALQSATGSFITTGQTGNFVVSAQTGAFLTTGAADGRYYTLSDGQSISGYAITGFNDAITGMTITGDTTKVITLFQRDGTTVTGSFIDNAGSGTGGGGGSINVNDSNLIISISMFA